MRRTGWVDCDEFDAKIVRARSAEDARARANNPDRYMEDNMWGDPSWATCEQLLEDGAPGVVLGSFNRG